MRREGKERKGRAEGKEGIKAQRVEKEVDGGTGCMKGGWVTGMCTGCRQWERAERGGGEEGQW